MPIRWLGVSIKPPVPGTDASTKLKGDDQSALAVVSMTLIRGTFFSCIRSGSARTWSCCSRWPQIATLATPGMPMSRGRMFQRARTDMSIKERSFEERPIIMARVMDERGCIIWGGFEAPGSATMASARRSWTTWRALSSSVPGSKTSSIEDRPGTDLELRMSTKGTLLRRSASSGTVTISATSRAERPSASLWTSTTTGPNSG